MKATYLPPGLQRCFLKTPQVVKCGAVPCQVGSAGVFSRCSFDCSPGALQPLLGWFWQLEWQGAEHAILPCSN